VSSEYRDELTAAQERLARLDAVQDARERERRRHSLERRRQALAAGGSDTTWTLLPYLSGLIAILAMKFAVLYPNSAGAGSLLLFGVAACVTVTSVLVVLSRRRERRKAFERINNELRELDEPHVRVAPGTLEEALTRIAEREAEAERDSDEEPSERPQATSHNG
jgi:hypothetical protein